MAVCLECKADYLQGITVCPACGRALEPDEPAPPPPSPDFVPLMGAGYVEGLAAAASLEAAGLETRLTTTDFHVYLGTPLHVSVLVRERDLDAARAALKLPAPPASGRTTEVPGCYYYGGQSPRVDEDVAPVVRALNSHRGVRTVCSCSGSHPGAGQGFIAITPGGRDPVGEKLFDDFLSRLEDKVRESGLSSRVGVEYSALHGAELRLLDSTHARVTWGDLARLVESV